MFADSSFKDRRKFRSTIFHNLGIHPENKHAYTAYIRQVLLQVPLTNVFYLNRDLNLKKTYVLKSRVSLTISGLHKYIFSSSARDTLFIEQ